MTTCCRPVPLRVNLASALWRDPGGRRIEGQKGYIRENSDPETAAKNAALVTTAKGLAPGRTLLAISAALAEQGYVTRHGKAFSASQVKRLMR